VTAAAVVVVDNIVGFAVAFAVSCLVAVAVVAAPAVVATVKNS